VTQLDRAPPTRGGRAGGSGGDAAATPVPQPNGWKRILDAWLALTVALAAPLAQQLASGRIGNLTDLFLVKQDMPVLITIACAAACLRLLVAIVGRINPPPGVTDAVTEPGRPALPRRPCLAVFALAALCGLAAYAGAHAVYDGYALSMDEFMARFDAAILAHGQPMAAVTPAWRSFVVALQPVFTFHTAGGGFWWSSYLPMNAALQALGACAGDEAITSPMLAAVSVLAIWAVGRRLWPQRPAIAWWAAILLATSSQFLITAMTPYAMTAHLAFNLVWLWLFLRGGVAGHAGALMIALLACGLHQLIFHPMFAAPFVLQLWLDRRWRLAALYTLAYGLIATFWIHYWQGALAVVGAAPAAPASVAASGFSAQALRLIGAFDPAAGALLMAANLIRFATWQNLLTPPLLVLSVVAAVRTGGATRALLAGIVLTAVAMFVLLPYQGHGWGYRYLHGLLGSACLLAAWRWSRMTERSAVGARSAQAAFMAAAAVSLLVLFPLRAWQTHAFVHPYAAAEAAIRRSPAQIVLVDGVGYWFGRDLVRNDPYLRNRPLVLYLGALTDRGARILCERYTVAVFDRDDAARFGIPIVAGAGPSARAASIGHGACGAAAK